MQVCWLYCSKGARRNAGPGYFFIFVSSAIFICIICNLYLYHLQSICIISNPYLYHPQVLSKLYCYKIFKFIYIICIFSKAPAHVFNLQVFDHYDLHKKGFLGREEVVAFICICFSNRGRSARKPQEERKEDFRRFRN